MIKPLCFGVSIWIMITSCTNDNEIIKHLESNDTDSLIWGSIRAGESGDKKFIPLLLKNAARGDGSTKLGLKGKSIYGSKMEALRLILKKEPPSPIVFFRVDSNIIKFYTDLYNQEKR